jgi:hypothetical protein
MRLAIIVALALVLGGCAQVRSTGSNTYELLCGYAVGWGPCERQAAQLCPDYDEVSRTNGIGHQLRIRCNGPVYTGGYRPLVDLKGKDLEQWKVDEAECLAYAPTPDPVGDAATGALLGAATGAAAGAAAVGPSGYAKLGATTGASYGAAYGSAANASRSTNEHIMIVQRCLAGRGYNILR